jgi:hypothetical protein
MASLSKQLLPRLRGGRVDRNGASWDLNAGGSGRKVSWLIWAPRGKGFYMVEGQRLALRKMRGLNGCNVCHRFTSTFCESCHTYVCEEHAYQNHPIPDLADGIEVPLILCDECNDSLLKTLFQPPSSRDRELEGIRTYLYYMYDDIPDEE